MLNQVKLSSTASTKFLLSKKTFSALGKEERQCDERVTSYGDGVNQKRKIFLHSKDERLSAIPFKLTDNNVSSRESERWIDQ